MAIKEIELKVPTSYADITLKVWLELQKELINYEDNEEAKVSKMNNAIKQMIYGQRGNA